VLENASSQELWLCVPWLATEGTVAFCGSLAIVVGWGIFCLGFFCCPMMVNDSGCRFGGGCLDGLCGTMGVMVLPIMSRAAQATPSHYSVGRRCRPLCCRPGQAQSRRPSVVNPDLVDLWWHGFAQISDPKKQIKRNRKNK
jgi:hypothetical protein